MNPARALPRSSFRNEVLDLAGFQQAFLRALLDTGTGAGVHGLIAQAGFAVHRNTVLGGCIDALEANYPVVAALVGRDCFRAQVEDYVRRSPPTDARLMVYGGDLDTFSSDLAASAGLPWLCGVARLERLWREAHLAADAPALDAAALQTLSPAALVDLHMAPHTAARWQWFDDAPVPGIWRAHQSEAELERRAALESLDWRAEGVLLTRLGGQVRVSSASRATCAFLDACARSAPLPEALAAAADARAAGPEPFDPATLLRCLLDAGALRALDNDS